MIYYDKNKSLTLENRIALKKDLERFFYYIMVIAPTDDSLLITSEELESIKKIVMLVWIYLEDIEVGKIHQDQIVDVLDLIEEIAEVYERFIYSDDWSETEECLFWISVFQEEQKASLLAG